MDHKNKPKKDTEFSTAEQVIAVILYILTIVPFCLSWTVFRYTDSLHNFMACRAWRLSGIHIPSNTIYDIMPSNVSRPINIFCLTALLDAIVIGSVLSLLYALFIKTYVPFLRTMETQNREHSKAKPDKLDACCVKSVAVFAACILAAMNIYAIYSISHMDGTFICVTDKGIYTENSPTHKKHNYTWDDVMTVKWGKNWYSERNGGWHYYLYYCVGMSDGSNIHLGSKELAADYISLHSNVVITKAKVPCPVCGSDDKPLWEDE